MSFAGIPAGVSLFIDANTFVYHFGPDPVLGPACTDLLLRIKRQEIDGSTSTHVVSEAAHRLMTLEAMKVFAWPLAGIASRLKKQSAQVQKLKAFRQAIQEIPQYGVRVLTIAPDLLDAAAAVSQQTGLLSNDALIVAVMQQHGLTNLASHDGDFDRVPGLTRYSPS